MEDKYEKSKKKAKEFYSSIGSVICPGLNNELVSFSKYGFYHLLRKRGVLRPRKEQLRRFALLHSAVEVIKNAKSYDSYNYETKEQFAEDHGLPVLKSSIAEFWSFSGIYSSKIVTVIVRKIGNGNMHFFSVMDK